MCSRVTMSRTFWITVCLAVIWDLCNGSPPSLFSGRTKRQTCDIKDEFTCNSGQCIQTSNMCDGTNECDDGSDESSDVCKALDKKSSDGCILPEPPDHGFYNSTLCATFDLSPACQNVPGTSVGSNWILHYQCRSGFGLPQNYIYTVCLHKQWTPFLPTCTKLCPKLESLSVRVTCIYQGSQVNCSEPMRPGTKATGICNTYYSRIYKPTYYEIECQDDGRWYEPLFFCTPVCGIANKDVTITGGPSEHRPIEYPWQVGLYARNENNEWEQACGGTLINPHIILTAAHCVYDTSSRKLLDISDIKIGLGKYYRDWMKTEIGEERRDVREIIAPLYEGKESSYAQDIALIDLSFSVRITKYIMPACVYGEAKFQIRPGMFGSLTGWAGTKKHMLSLVLHTVQLPVIERSKCRSEIPDGLQRYLTPDKFCAGYKNGTGVGLGSSGSGLTFVQEDGIHRVFGILSIGARGLNTYYFYTNVTNVELFQWLNKEQIRLNRAHSNAAEN